MEKSSKGAAKGLSGRVLIEQHFLVPTKNIFKNYNTWLWPRLTFVELHSKDDNPVNKLVKQKNRTVNYRNKCDFLYFAKRLISFLISSVHSVNYCQPASQT